MVLSPALGTDRMAAQLELPLALGPSRIVSLRLFAYW